MGGTGTGIYTGSTGSGTGAATTKTLQHHVLDDLDVFFDVTGGFAREAIYIQSGYAPTVIPVLFDQIDGAMLGMEGTLITVTAKTADVAAAKPGETLAINGVTYKIKSPPVHDAHGTTTIDLTID